MSMAMIIPFPNAEVRAALLGHDSPVARSRTEWEQVGREYIKRLEKLQEAGVPARCRRALADKGAISLADVARIDPMVLYKSRNVGTKSIRDLKAMLLNTGITLGPAWEAWQTIREDAQ
jgi:DNA-directed RNA polymerase alpha subunit